MSAELLRRAAVKLREHATAADAGTWNAYDDGLIWPEPPVLGDPVGGASLNENARYFALMHPPVALALADLLDAEAALVHPNTVAANAKGAQRLATLTAMARAILREEES